MPARSGQPVERSEKPAAIAEHRRADERHGALVGSHQPFDISPEFGILAAGFREKSIAIHPVALECGVKEFVDVSPVLGIHGRTGSEFRAEQRIA
jgi:hypothetical protein